MSVHVSSWAWAQRVGDPEAKLVLLKLADQANDEGQCWPSRRTIAEACETSVSTVRRRLNYLVERKLLIVEERARPTGLQTSNLYTVPYRDVRSSALTSAGSPVDHREPAGGSPGDPPGGSVAGPASRLTSVNHPEPSLEPSRESSFNRASTNVDSSSTKNPYAHLEQERLDRHAAYETGVADDALEHLREMRKKLGL